MAAFYEVWDFETRNIINSFASEAAALLFLGRLFELNGPDGVRELGLMRQTPDVSGEYEPVLILDGDELLARVRAANGPSAPETRRAAG
jgi:hypothetical protein